MTTQEAVVPFEHKVQKYYDAARIAFEGIMGTCWHHGDPEAEDVGIVGLKACEVIEERVARFAGIQPGNRVFDFGSGIGGPTLHMAKVTGASFVGVTNNERLNVRARERAKELGLSERSEFVTLDDLGYKNLPRDRFGDRSFDAATFFESVCHLPDKAALFKEIFRILKPGARLGGIDWIQRRFREIQTEQQIMKFMRPVNQYIRIPWHGTVEGYRDMMTSAGFEVLLAKDLFEGIECWGSTPPEEAPLWLNYEGPDAEVFIEGKKALDAARKAGVFSVGMWVARKPL